ncbi:LysR family transcriptional regulator [Phenylobacterium sp.]|uniref:LysR family transcriptional regulator n=1 Tax=Phenylobacterium sp. TaxID=1871053 RepID=UPI0025E77392|nr:LysR family transcriptional regulator [Phenylobacterium sp.]
MLDLEDILTFAEVAESGGLTRAGERLGLSKSIISRRLSRLEDALGAQLLARTTRGVSLTEAGEAFLRHAETIQGEVEAAREAVSQGDEVRGRLRLSAPLSFGATHLGPVLADFALRHPKLEIQASYSDRYVDLIGERFDAAIRIGRLPDSSLIARRIAPIAIAVVASPDYLARHGTPETPQDLQRHDAVGQPDEVWRFGEGARALALRPRIRFQADSGQALLAAAVAGVGVAMLPTFLCGPAIATGELVALVRDHPIPEAGLYVVRPPPADHAPRKVRRLTEVLLEHFGGEPVWDACYEALRQAAP